MLVITPASNSIALIELKISTESNPCTRKNDLRTTTGMHYVWRFAFTTERIKFFKKKQQRHRERSPYAHAPSVLP